MQLYDLIQKNYNLNKIYYLQAKIKKVILQLS
jgi:hypothetical protein